MGNEDDILRLRNDVAELYELHRDTQARIVRLEADSVNRDDKIGELKASIRELETMIRTGLAGLSAQVSALAKAPADKIAGRWEEVIKTLITLGAGAAFAYFIGRTK